MNAVPFDTLKMARGLEAAGLPPAQAAGVAETLAEAMSSADLATKADIAELRTEMNHRFDSTQAEMNSRFGSLQMQQESAHTSLRTELKAEIAQVRSDLELLRRDLVIRLGGMIFLAAGMIIAAMRYMPPHP